MFNDGFVRDPNNEKRWYAGHAGKLEPVFPLEIFVTDKIWLCVRKYGDACGEFIPLMAFNAPNDLEGYLDRNGKPSEVAAAYSNSWD